MPCGPAYSIGKRGHIVEPLLGGLLIFGDNWHWIFWVNVPIGAVALALALLFVPESRDESISRTVDWPGLVLLSGAVFLLLFGLTQAHTAGWTSPKLLTYVSASAAAVIAFVVIECRTLTPLVDLSLIPSARVRSSGLPRP